MQMNKDIPPIKAEIDYLDKNESEIYCVGDWISAKIDGKMVPVRIKSISHDGIIVSNSPNIDYPLSSAEALLQKLYNLLSSGKELFCTKTALCAQYAILLVELDNAIVRLNIDKNLIKRATIFKTPTDYNAWAQKIKEAGKNWGYKDMKEADDACYFYPGFEYKEFIERHEQYWEALHDKLDALVKILLAISKYVNKTHSTPETIATRMDKEKTDTIADIYISYPWANSNRMDEICCVLDHAGLKYKRDIKDCGYRQNIRQFEREIGKGAKVLAYINEDYLKSINCMYEMALVFHKGDVERRLFPIVTLTGKRDSAFFKALYDYWNAKYLKKRDLLNSLSSGVSLQVIDELGYCDEIIRELPKISSYLSDVNTLTYEQLAENDFKRLLEELNRHVNM
jgi:hypothetical protein